MRRWTAWGFLLAASIVWSIPAAAQEDYPNKPVHAVIGFAAGGGSDINGRYFAAQLQKVSGKTFVIENKPGNNGNVASSLVANAKPDGYTIYFGSSSTLVGARFFVKDVTFDVKRDFTPIASFIEGGWVVLVAADSPAKSVDELIALLKSRPQNRYGYANQVGLLASHYFKSVGKFEADGASYRNEAELMPDLAAGTLEFAMVAATLAVPQMKSGKFRILAAMTSKRYPALADVPLLKELPGFGEAEFTSWWAMYAPKGVQASVVDKLAGWMRQVTSSPETAEYLARTASIPLNDERDAIFQRVDREVARWAPLVKAAGIEPQ